MSERDKGFDDRMCPNAERYPVFATVEVEAEIVDGCIAPFDRRENPQPKVVVRCGEWWLRYSKGPRTGTFWDTYGEDFHNVELAQSELRKAPPVPRGKPYVTFALPLGEKPTA